MGIIITGHQRSGTSLLRLILDTHPDIRLTAEFGCYLVLGTSFRNHSRFIFRRWWDRRNNAFFRNQLAQQDKAKDIYFAKNLRFISRYLASLYRQEVDTISSAAVTNALKSALSDCAHAGDKHPDYTFQLDRLAGDPDIKTIVIIRDARDVVSSSVEKGRGAWRNSWPAEMRDVEAVARRWINMVDAVDRNRDSMHVVYYEQLVNNPEIVLSRLAPFIGVDGKRFNCSLVHANSIGKYQQGLSPSELTQVLAIAGEHMRASGYNPENPG